MLDMHLSYTYQSIKWSLWVKSCKLLACSNKVIDPFKSLFSSDKLEVIQIMITTFTHWERTAFYHYQ